MTEFTPQQIAQIAQILGAMNAAQTKSGTPRKAKADILSAKDKSLLAGFHRKGYKDVVLMDRADPTKPFNVRPFNGWVAQGRIVRKGERGVRGLFHISQTDKVEAAPKAPKEGKFQPNVKTEAKPQVAGKSIQEALAKMMATAKTAEAAA